LIEPKIVVDGARVFHGDCRDVLRSLPDNSVDSVVTDPPYELGFMGKKWDSSGIAYDVTVWQECLRVLKPGGHVLAFGGSRTWHRLAVAVEDAGFELRDSIAWIYGSGFPKSLDVSKAIDKRGGGGALLTKEIGEALRVARESRGISKSKADEIFCDGTTNWTWFEGRPAGQRPPTSETFARIVAEWPELAELSEKVAEAEREVIGQKAWSNSANHFVPGKNHKARVNLDETAPATSEAQQWQGWGTALKPAFEPVVVGRKPFGKGVTVAENVLQWGVGGLNIDGSRIHIGENDKGGFRSGTYTSKNESQSSWEHRENGDAYTKPQHPQGRWPANVILDEVTAGLLDEQSGVSVSKSGGKAGTIGFHSGGSGAERGGHEDSGGASRFFYVAKASKRDRNEGLEDLEAQRHADRVVDDGPGGDNPRNRTNTPRQNFHPTVKPTQLMRYLIKLVTPPGGTVLDPFTGSGSTGKAALLDGFEFVGAELTGEYLPIIEGRLRWAVENRETGETLF
jgi:DNA modification methylase